MPTLNYENAGALTEFDYLQGTVTAIDSEMDTADVSGACGALSAVPIFYHCKPDSVARDNGALEGAAGGFAVGDSVIVLKAFESAASSLNSLDQIELKGSEGNATGPKYFVIGHYDGVRPCSAVGIVFVASRLFYNAPETFDYFFWWDLRTDDYAIDPYNNQDVYSKEDYPIEASPSTYPAASSLNRLCDLIVQTRTAVDGVYVSTARIITAEKIIYSKTYDFGAAYVCVGDYVYITSRPLIYSVIKAVSGGLLKLSDSAVTDFLVENPGAAFHVASSIPLYSQTGDSIVTILESSIGPGLNAYMSAKTTTEYACSIPGAQGYTASYITTYTAIDTGGIRTSISTLGGVADPLAGVNYTEDSFLFFRPWPQAVSPYSENFLFFTTLKSSFQFYIYNTGIVHAQSSGKPGLSNTRSSKLESAIADLIQHSRDSHSGSPVIYTAIEGRYYSETRQATYGSDILAILNAVRGFPPPLTEDPWCMSSSEEKVASFIASCSCFHGDLSYIGMEIFATALDTVPIGEIVAGWMDSPLHAAAVMGPTWRVAGWADAAYPETCEGIDIGPGAYNAIDGTYTTESTYMAIPLDLRGRVKCYVVRMTPEPEA